MDIIKDLNTNLVAGWLIAVVATVLCGLFGCLHYLRTKRQPPAALSSEFQSFPLIQKDILSHDTRRFTFALPSPKHRLGLPIGQHMTLAFVDTDGTQHQRSYTPVTDDTTLGQVSFIIKVYHANVHPKFPLGGKVSQHLDSLKIGDTMLMKGPKGHLHWLGKGKFTLKLMKKPLQHRSCTHLGMMAGGTGITPMLQVLHAIFRNPHDTTCVKLLYANQTEDDILVRGELEALARTFPDRFQLHYTIDRVAHPDSTTWKYSVGFINKEMVANFLYNQPDPGHSIQVFMCGPPPMIKFACLPALQELGFTEEDWYVF